MEGLHWCAVCHKPVASRGCSGVKWEPQEFFYKEKCELTKWKFSNALPSTIPHTDVMPLINRIFHRAYNNKQNNLKAMCERGWFPPNRALLNHSMLTDDTAEATKPSDSTTGGVDETNTATVVDTTAATANSVVATMNVDTGMGAVVIDTLCHYRARSEAGIQAKEKRKKTSQDVLKSLKDATRLTAGVMVKEGIHSPNNQIYLDAVRQKQVEAEEKVVAQEKHRKQRKKKNEK